MPSPIQVFKAARVVTLNTSLHTATHIAVQDGRILGAGGAEMVDAFGPATLDDRFADHVIVPGFVEGHGHAADGMMWRNAYVGYFPRTAPDGTEMTTRITEGMTEYRCGDQVGYGLSEYLDQIVDGRPSGMGA